MKNKQFIALELTKIFVQQTSNETSYNDVLTIYNYFLEELEVGEE